MCVVSEYLWRPDFVTMKGKCNDSIVSMELAYLSNATFCARYNLSSTADTAFTFGGSAGPQHGNHRTVRDVRALGTAVVVDISAYSQYGTPDGNHKYAHGKAYPPTNLDRHWVIRTSAGVSPVIEKMNYNWHVPVKGDGGIVEATFCVIEMQEPVPAQLTPCPVYAEGVLKTTENIDGWFAELSLPAGVTNRAGLYNSWFQFWYNTEHDAGNWTHPMITPSMNTYGRGMWLWDSAFHVMSLASGGIGPRSLKLAGDQLRVLINAGSNIGHIPRVVGSVGLEETTQPPGILTWASLVYFNRTQDKAFLAEAYAAFVVNNRWYYTEPGYATDTGLSTWCCEDSGWDTSPRWDNGTVEAVDLNGWLHIDQLLLARMATALGKPQEAYAWKKKAFSTATAFSARLWDNSSGVFWDRLPNRTTAQNAFVKVVTPATFWSLFAGIATPAQAKAQVAASLVPGKLATAYPLPCVGVKESRFEEKNYWRGPTWINVNWLSALGFDCYGLNTEAKHIREMSAKVVGMSPYPREYYDAITGGGLGAQNYMWTGAIDIIIENELAGRTIVADVLHGVLDCPGVS